MTTINATAITNNNNNAPPQETSLLNACLTDELLGRIFAFLAPEDLATTSARTAADDSSLDGVRHVILVCRRFRQIIYQPQFWKVALGGMLTTTTTTSLVQQRIGQSVLLATPAPTGLHFHGFRKIATQTPKLPHEQRFLVQEHWSAKRLILSSVTIEPDHEPREFMQQLQFLSRLMQQGKLKDPYYKVGISVGERLVFVRCMDERLVHHAESAKFRSTTLSSPQTQLWENRHGSSLDLRTKWPGLVDWIFEVSLVFKLEIDTMFRATQLVQYAFLRNSSSATTSSSSSQQGLQLFCTANAQLVAAAATFIMSLLDEKAERTLSLTDLSHSMDNRWSADAIWSCVKILLTLHADRLGEPTILDFILVYFCYDDDDPIQSDVTRRTVTLAMLAACSTLVEDYPSRVVAACVCCLARFPLPESTAANRNNGQESIEVWSDSLAAYTQLPWETLPLEEARAAIQVVLRTPHLLMSKFAHDLSSVAHLAFLPTGRDLELYRHKRAQKRARLAA